MIKGVIALLGIAGGAVAYYKYKEMSPEKKEAIKDKFRKTGREMKEAAYDLGKAINDESESLFRKAKETYQQATQ